MISQDVHILCVAVKDIGRSYSRTWNQDYLMPEGIKAHRLTVVFILPRTSISWTACLKHLDPCAPNPNPYT